MSVFMCLEALAADQFQATISRERALENLEHFQSEESKQQSENFWESLETRKYLTGNWNGDRNYIAEQGVSIGVSVVGNFAGNASGGVSRGFTQLTSTGVNIGLDFEKAAGLDGLFGFVSTAYREGTSLTNRRIGNIVNVQQVFGGETFHLVNVYLEQIFFEDRSMSIKIGRIAQFDDFAHEYAFGFYMNNAFDGQPIGFFFQGPFTAYPTVTWGAIIKGGIPLDDQNGLYSYLGVYGADSNLGDNRYHGARLSFHFNQGANIMWEGGWKHDWGPTAAPNSNPGKYSGGFWWFTGTFPVFTNNGLNDNNKTGIGGFYYNILQNLYREKPLKAPSAAPEAEKASVELYWGKEDDHLVSMEGLFFWSTAQFAGASTSTWDTFFSASLYYRGLIPGRGQDVSAIAFYQGFFSNQLETSQRANGETPQTYESGIELSYRYYVVDYFYVQPNLQYIINPGGRGDIDNAFVIGAQVQVDL